MRPKDIIIVGGGTAGWLAALMLAGVAVRAGWGAGSLSSKAQNRHDRFGGGVYGGVPSVAAAFRAGRGRVSGGDRRGHQICLDLWQTRLPEPGDFDRFPLGLPHLQGQLYIPVLDGLGLLNRTAARAAMAANPALRDKVRAVHGGLVAEYARAAELYLPHRAWLEGLKRL